MAFLTIYGQNFDDYFEIEEKTETSPIYKTAITSTLPTSSTSSMSTTTPTTSTSPTSTTSSMSTTHTTSLTTPTPSTATTTCTCDEKINPNLISLVKEMIVGICEKKIDTTTTTTRTTTEATTTTTDKMDRFFEDVFSEFEENIKLSKPGKR
jgi:hypothetical protein